MLGERVASITRGVAFGPEDVEAEFAAVDLPCTTALARSMAGESWPAVWCSPV